MHASVNSLSLAQLKDAHAKAMSSSAASAESKLAAAMAEKDIIDAQVSHTCQCVRLSPDGDLQKICVGLPCYARATSMQGCTKARLCETRSRWLRCKAG